VSVGWSGRNLVPCAPSGLSLQAQPTADAARAAVLPQTARDVANGVPTHEINHFYDLASSLRLGEEKGKEVLSNSFLRVSPIIAGVGLERGVGVLPPIVQWDRAGTESLTPVRPS